MSKRKVAEKIILKTAEVIKTSPNPGLIQDYSTHYLTIPMNTKQI